MFEIGERTEYRSSIGSDGYWLQRFHRVINGVPFSFTRVEDGNRNAYVEVWRDGEQVHLWRGKATGPRAGIQVLSENLGGLLRF